MTPPPIARAIDLNREQERVIDAIVDCRTAALGGHVEECGQCAYTRILYNSCRNRHCPKCQSLARAKWVEGRKAEVLPVEYFHVVFTVPEEIAAIAFHNRRVVYTILFQATAQTIATIARDPQHLGAEIAGAPPNEHFGGYDSNLRNLSRAVREIGYVVGL